MGILLTTYRSVSREIGSGLSDIFDLTATNLPGADEANEFAPAVHLLGIDKIAALVPVGPDGALRWGGPSRNFAGAIDDMSWLAATHRLTGSFTPLVRVFDQPIGPGFEIDPGAIVLPAAIAPATAGGANADSLAAEFAEHLRMRLEKHGFDDTAVLIDGTLFGVAQFVASIRGHDRVRSVFKTIVEIAEKNMLTIATPESGVRQ